MRWLKERAPAKPTPIERRDLRSARATLHVLRFLRRLPAAPGRRHLIEEAFASGSAPRARSLRRDRKGMTIGFGGKARWTTS